MFEAVILVYASSFSHFYFTVDELVQLTKLKVVVYNAQLDLIVETLGMYL